MSEKNKVGVIVSLDESGKLEVNTNKSIPFLSTIGMLIVGAVMLITNYKPNEPKSEIIPDKE